VITLNKVIETGKSSNVETDRHMHLSWDQFRRIKEDYERLFDQLICTDPDRVRSMHEELVMLSKEVELGWNLKQDQLEDLTDILHHENYNATGLSTGNDGVDQLCEGLTEYIEKVNKTAWEVEKPELDEHLQEVEDIEIAIATHPCPCVWSSWEGWSECSTTCEAGSRNRQREIEKEAINNGAECVEDKEEKEACNEDVCCPVNCEWGAWVDWGACPSGCDQEKTRIRQKIVMESCNGIACTGKDYEKMSCSRERELEDEIKELEEELDTCQATSNPNTECLAKPAEIAFVVDHSFSMRSVWENVKAWLEALVDAYKIDGIKRKGGLVVWSTMVLTSATILFTESKTAEELKAAIHALPNPIGVTYGGKALNYTWTNLFEAGSDPSVFREIIFISDGESLDSLTGPAELFHNPPDGTPCIRITAVALGNFNHEGVNNMLSNNCGDRLITNDDSDELTSDEFLGELTTCDAQLA